MRRLKYKPGNNLLHTPPSGIILSRQHERQLPMEKRTWAKLVVTMVVIAGICAGIYCQWYRQAGKRGSVAPWGVGDLRTAERSYYTNRINNIIANWLNTRSSAEHDEKGRFTDSYKTLLVIDPANSAMWIEENGQIQQDNRVELPANMKWTLYRVTAQGREELRAVTRIKLRGYNSGQNYPEEFYLVGSGRRSGYMHFNFGANSKGSGSGSAGTFTPPSYSFTARETEDSYPSLILTEAEYERYRSLPAPSPADPSSQAMSAQDQSRIEKNKASWRKVEKLLYQEIERQVLAAGYALRDIEVVAGPDFSAAHAEAGLRAAGVLREMFAGYWGDAYLKIDLIGDDIWYCADARHPQQPAIPRRDEIDLEFIVCPAGEVPESKRAELLEVGREIQMPQAAAMPSKWKVILPNGATAQFIGICENPNAGRQWWGPDGAPIDYTPYVNTEAYDQPSDDKKTFEMVWKVEFPKMPDGSSGGGTSTSLEGSLGSYGGTVRDRYGSPVLGEFSTGGYSFENSQSKTTLKLGVKVGDNDEYQWVEFKDISLVRGEDQGFKIEIEKK